jgi:hypothetical protein
MLVQSQVCSLKYTFKLIYNKSSVLSALGMTKLLQEGLANQSEGMHAGLVSAKGCGRVPAQGSNI